MYVLVVLAGIHSFSVSDLTYDQCMAKMEFVGNKFEERAKKLDTFESWDFNITCLPQVNNTKSHMASLFD